MLQTIDDDEKTIRTALNKSGSKWFLTEDGLYEVLMQSRKPIAKDVAEWIEYSKTSQGYYNTSKMLLTIDEDEKTTITNSNSGGSKIYLTEDGVYEVLMQSRKPIAKDVAEWIDYDVSNVSKMIKSVDEDEKTTRTTNTNGSYKTEDGVCEVLLITVLNNHLFNSITRNLF